MMTQPIIKKGERFYDEEGKLYCTANRDIVFGNPCRIDDFVFADGHVHTEGPIPCKQLNDRIDQWIKEIHQYTD